jgi:3-oxoacyl-[acyl-carrier protein] reductase
VLINNSGFGKSTLVWETEEADWDEVMDTNVKGAYLMCKSVVPAMIANRDGYILNIASQQLCTVLPMPGFIVPPNLPWWD